MEHEHNKQPEVAQEVDTLPVHDTEPEMQEEIHPDVIDHPEVVRDKRFRLVRHDPAMFDADRRVPIVEGETQNKPQEAMKETRAKDTKS